MLEKLLHSLSKEILYTKSPIPFFIGDLKGNIRLTNEAFCRLFGPEDTARITRVWSDLARQARDVQDFKHNSLVCIDLEQESLQAELQVFEVHSLEPGERLFSAFLIHQDNISLLKDQVQSSVLVDALTGLPNRYLGQDRLQKLLERLRR